jgi:hypothetical protein
MEGSISQRARQGVRRTREDRQPDFVVRARSGRAWAQIGAAWKGREDGNVVVSVKVNAIPVGFDGVIKIMLPLEEDPSDEPASE